MNTIACTVCGLQVPAGKSNKQYCSDRCRLQHRSVIRTAEREERRARVLQMLDCPVCATPFMQRAVTQKYCAVRCERVVRNQRLADQDRERAEVRVKARPPRFCPDCNIPIDHLSIQAQRCKACSIKGRKRRAAGQAPVAHRDFGRPPPTRKVPPRRDAPKQGPVKPKEPKPSLLPNYDGDWFPGWNGCYSPNLTPEGIERIERAFGPGVPKGVDPTKKKARNDEAA